jgi:pantoate--beta-alanine ligase
MSTRIFRSLPEWRDFRTHEIRRGRSLGFVPTMGALHQGHLALVRRARMENETAAVSIFVNPTQFNDPGDLAAYPRTFDQDLAKLESLGTEYVLAPQYEELYADGFRYRVSESSVSNELEGVQRPGHFDGVLTVVLKLLGLARPERAYFGEKDYQQMLLVRGMAEAFFLTTEIISCPTVREHDGLAMSSRNALLPPDARKLAPALHRTLSGTEDLSAAREALTGLGFDVEYLEERYGRRLVAARVAGVRLIDNVSLG